MTDRSDGSRRSHSRLEATVVGVVERPAGAVLPGAQDLPGGQVDVDLPVILLDEGEVNSRRCQVQVRFEPT